MPKAISAPFPHAAAQPSAREHARAAKQAWHAQPIESRVSALEARWEETVPTLATRSDVRGELRGVENRLIIWILGAAFTLLFAVLGIFLSGYNSINERFDSVNTQIHSINARFDSVNARIDSAVTEIRTETKASIADLRDELRTEIRETNARMDARFERMDARFERLDSKFDALMEELRSQRNDAR